MSLTHSTIIIYTRTSERFEHYATRSTPNPVNSLAPLEPMALPQFTLP